MEERAFFLRKRVLFDRLLPFGFQTDGDSYRFSTELLDGQFRLLVGISADGRVDTRVLDAATGEEYVLHRVPDAVGAFTGAVREAYAQALNELAERCFERDVFQSEQARALIVYARETYGDTPEYLWEKFPDNAVWRRQDNKKWYGALLTVSRQKLGLPAAGVVEIVNLRVMPEDLEALIDGAHFFPGWHMNKKSWYTVLLDGSIPLEQLQDRLDASYALAAKKERSGHK